MDMTLTSSFSRSIATMVVSCGIVTTLSAQYMPPIPAAPTSYAECNAYRSAVNQLETEMLQEHEACLANHSKEQSNPNAGGLVCSHAACQSYHDYVYGDKKKYMDEQADQCNQEVADYLARINALQQQQQQQQQNWQQQEQSWETQQQAAQSAAQQKQAEAVQKAEARNDAIRSASNGLTSIAKMLGLGSGNNSRVSGGSTTLEISAKTANSDTASAVGPDPEGFAKDFSPMVKPDIPAIIKAGISSTGPQGETIVDTYDKFSDAKDKVDNALSLPSLWNAFVNGDPNAKFTVIGGAAQNMAAAGSSNPLQGAIMSRGIDTILNVSQHAFGDLDNAFQAANQGIFNSSYTSYNSSTPVYQVGYITVTEPDIAELPPPSDIYSQPSRVELGDDRATPTINSVYQPSQYSDSESPQDLNCRNQPAQVSHPGNPSCSPDPTIDDGGPNAFSRAFGVAR